MEIIVEKKNAISILKLNGRLDTGSSAFLAEKLTKLIEQNERRIVVDFTDLSFISSSGLRVLLMAGKRLKSTDGNLVLSALQNHVKDVFDVAGFTMLFSMYPSQEEALKGLSDK